MKQGIQPLMWVLFDTAGMCSWWIPRLSEPSPEECARIVRGADQFYPVHAPHRIVPVAPVPDVNADYWPADERMSRADLRNTIGRMNFSLQHWKRMAMHAVTRSQHKELNRMLLNINDRPGTLKLLEEFHKDVAHDEPKVGIRADLDAAGLINWLIERVKA